MLFCMFRLLTVLRNQQPIEGKTDIFTIAEFPGGYSFIKAIYYVCAAPKRMVCYSFRYEIGSISAVFSSPVFDPREKELSGVSAGSIPEQRLVLEPRYEIEVTFNHLDLKLGKVLDQGLEYLV